LERVKSIPANPLPGKAYLLQVEEPLSREDWAPGTTNAICGRLVGKIIEQAVELCQNQAVKAMITSPINKSALHAAGYPYPGHTEFLAKLTETENYAMMLMGGSIRVVLATIHVALSEVPQLISQEEICRIFRLTHRSMEEWFGIKQPRIAVAALNPHAGEDGAFGDEETKIIVPSIEKLKREGFVPSGPHPADTLFYRQKRGEFDAVLAMYHDQGLIPVKLDGFDTGVNLTLGLPIIRTSVDHGTAFEIAGKGVANPNSLASAIKKAASISKNRLN
jgi:4-hydroxythreonine-4-phosphate dehydrogenase